MANLSEAVDMEVSSTVVVRRLGRSLATVTETYVDQAVHVISFTVYISFISLVIQLYSLLKSFQSVLYTGVDLVEQEQDEVAESSASASSTTAGDTPDTDSSTTRLHGPVSKTSRTASFAGLAARCEVMPYEKSLEMQGALRACGTCGHARPLNVLTRGLKQRSSVAGQAVEFLGCGVGSTDVFA